MRSMAVYEQGRFLPGSILVVDITGQDVEETGLVWEDGDADRLARPIPGRIDSGAVARRRCRADCVLDV